MISHVYWLEKRLTILRLWVGIMAPFAYVFIVILNNIGDDSD